MQLKRELDKGCIHISELKNEILLFTATFKGHTMIKLQLTKKQTKLVWVAIRQAEETAYVNEAVKVGDDLNFIRRELEYKIRAGKKENETVRT